MSSSPAFSGRLVVLVGNPSPGSRTSAVAQVVSSRLGSGFGGSAEVIELAELGAAGVASGDERVRRAQTLVSRADLLVVATPVHKAGFTGLLKLFLDGLDPTSLEGTVALPVVLSASSAHGAIADLQLRLVLQAVGALLPVPSFVLEEHHLDHLEPYVDAWQRRFGPAITAVADALRQEEVGAR
jgi:FMN reductase